MRGGLSLQRALMDSQNHLYVYLLLNSDYYDFYFQDPEYRIHIVAMYSNHARQLMCRVCYTYTGVHYTNTVIIIHCVEIFMSSYIPFPICVHVGLRARNILPP